LISAADAAEIKVIDAVSTIKDGEIVIAVIFDKQVDPKFFYDDFISISGAGNFYYKKGAIDPNRRIIYYSGFPGGKKFRINVWQGFQGAGGATLESDFSKQLTTPTFKTGAWFNESGLISVLKENKALNLNVSNLDSITVNYYVIPFSESKPYLADPNGEKNILAASEPALSKSYKANSLHKQTALSIALPDELFNNKGLYFAAVINANKEIISAAAFIDNELNIHARYYPLAKKNNLAVWVMNGDSPVEQATVGISFHDPQESVEELTDLSGKAEFNIPPINGVEAVNYITAAKDNLSAVLFSAETLDLSSYNISGESYSDLNIFIYGTKDSYFKGETAKYYVMARDNDGKANGLEDAEFAVTDQAGLVIKSTSFVNKKAGYSEISIKTEDSSASGEWKLSVKIGGQSAARSFAVENHPKIKLALLNIKAQADNTSALSFKVRGENLEDQSPAIGILKGNYSVKTVSRIGGYDGYSFSAAASAGRYSVSPKNLNKGETTFTLDDVPLNTPLSLTFDLNLSEKDDITARLSEEILLLPGGEAAGVKYKEGAGESLFSIINIDSNGKPKKAKLSCLLLKEEKSLIWSESETEDSAELSATVYPLAEQNIETGATPKELKFKTSSGSYRLEVKNLATSAVTVFNFSAGGTQTADTLSNMEIILDKESYQPGEALRAVINSPFDGSARLLVEDSEGILRFQIFNITNGKGEVNFPINTRWKRRDIYISAFMYNNIDAKGLKDGNAGYGKLSFGIVHLPINNNSAIELKIEHPESVPGGIDVEVVVRASENFEGASVALALADAEISGSFDFPETFFSRQLAYLPIILDNSAVRLKEVGGRKIRAEDAPDAFSKGKEHNTALLTNPISFDKNGEARFKVRIPDYSGELRLTALAFGKEGFGSENSYMSVKQAVEYLGKF
jgi:uncharacterized protein YfaS (alpha-2-macroglobulin family)